MKKSGGERSESGVQVGSKYTLFMVESGFIAVEDAGG
jgi:hypothetical protein